MGDNIGLENDANGYGMKAFILRASWFTSFYLTVKLVITL